MKKARILRVLFVLISVFLLAPHLNAANVYGTLNTYNDGHPANRTVTCTSYYDGLVANSFESCSFLSCIGQDTTGCYNSYCSQFSPISDEGGYCWVTNCVYNQYPISQCAINSCSGSCDKTYTDTDATNSSGYYSCSLTDHDEFPDNYKYRYFSNHICGIQYPQTTFAATTPGAEVVSDYGSCGSSSCNIDMENVPDMISPTGQMWARRISAAPSLITPYPLVYVEGNDPEDKIKTGPNVPGANPEANYIGVLYGTTFGDTNMYEYMMYNGYTLWLAMSGFSAKDSMRGTPGNNYTDGLTYQAMRLVKDISDLTEDIHGSKFRGTIVGGFSGGGVSARAGLLRWCKGDWNSYGLPTNCPEIAGWYGGDAPLEGAVIPLSIQRLACDVSWEDHDSTVLFDMAKSRMGETVESAIDFFLDYRATYLEIPFATEQLYLSVENCGTCWTGCFDLCCNSSGFCASGDPYWAGCDATSEHHDTFLYWTNGCDQYGNNCYTSPRRDGINGPKLPVIVWSRGAAPDNITHTHNIPMVKAVIPGGAIDIYANSAAGEWVNGEFVDLSLTQGGIYEGSPGSKFPLAWDQQYITESRTECVIRLLGSCIWHLTFTFYTYEAPTYIPTHSALATSTIGYSGLTDYSYAGSNMNHMGVFKPEVAAMFFAFVHEQQKGNKSANPICLGSYRDTAMGDGSTTSCRVCTAEIMGNNKDDDGDECVDDDVVPGGCLNVPPCDPDPAGGITRIWVGGDYSGGGHSYHPYWAKVDSDGEHLETISSSHTAALYEVSDTEPWDASLTTNITEGELFAVFGNEGGGGSQYPRVFKFYSGSTLVSEISIALDTWAITRWLEDPNGDDDYIEFSFDGTTVSYQQKTYDPLPDTDGITRIWVGGTYVGGGASMNPFWGKLDSYGELTQSISASHSAGLYQATDAAPWDAGLTTNISSGDLFAVMGWEGGGGTRVFKFYSGTTLLSEISLSLDTSVIVRHDGNTTDDPYVEFNFDGTTVGYQQKTWISGSCDCSTNDDCVDTNECTSDICDGCYCSNDPVADDTPCPDSNICNGTETCQSGACIAGTPLDCNDYEVCTDDSCDPASGCQFVAVANNTSCADATVCNGAETCQSGQCTAGTPLTCNDSNVCTTDSCNPTSGCQFVNNTASCDDGIACNGTDTCSGGVCSVHSDVCECSINEDCDDSKPCTDNVCSNGFCTYPANNSLSCDDGNVCNGAETCSGGNCQAGNPLTCNDSNVCTTDSCDPASGCQFANNTASCDDGIACNGTDTCGGGTCSIHSDTCDVDVYQNGPFTHMVDSRTQSDAYYSTDNTCMENSGGRDVAVMWTAGSLQNQAIDIITWPQSNDGVIHIREGDCSGPEVLCTDCNGYFSGCGHARVNDFVATASQYCIILDTYSGSGGGVMRLEVRDSSDDEICTNGVDDDSDGATDCSDWKCYTNTQCNPEPNCYEASTAMRAFQENIWYYDNMNWRQTNIYDPSCDAPGGIDGVMTWSTLAAGAWAIDTFGSNYNTVLWAKRGTCGGEEVACNDDYDGGQQSKIFICAEGAGEVYVIGADTHSSDTPGSNIEVNATWLGPDCSVIPVCECSNDNDCSDDGNVCTTSVCDGCHCSNVNNTESCDDGLWCNGTDTCSGGACTHQYSGNERCDPDTCNESSNTCETPSSGGDIGYTTVFSQTSTATDRRAQQVTATSAGNLQSITIYQNGGSGGMLLAVYADDGGVPGTRLGVTQEVQISSSAGWETANLISPVSISSGQKVWLAWVFEDFPGVRAEDGTPGRASSGSGWSGGMPSDFGSASISDYIYSIYATYSGGGCTDNGQCEDSNPCTDNICSSGT
jgi:hypothetical protein